MAMSSGKSSCMAAVLLVVAVVAGTCASGVQAQYSYNITNNCSKAVEITTKSGAYTLAPGGSIHVPVPPTLYFAPPVTFIFPGTGAPPIRIPQSALDELTKLGVQLQKIEIQCKGGCIWLIVTYKPPGGAPVTLPPLGPFCP